MSAKENPTVEEIMIRYLIKYERLDQAIQYAFSAYDNARNINIYVDLFGLYRTIWSRSYRTTINDYMAFTSGAVNICGHYRDYFRRIGVASKIFLISSLNRPDSIISELPDYHSSMKDKLGNTVIGEMMHFNMDLLDLLCPYLPDIHFLHTNFESSVLINDLILREGEQIPSLIITTDLYPLQLTYLHPNVAYIWPRKMFDKTQYGWIDISPICPPISHPEYRKSFSYVITRKEGKTTSEEDRGYVSPSNQVLLQALNRFTERDLKTITNVKVASKIINESCLTPDQQLYIPDIKDKMIELGYGDKIELVEKRFKALDVRYQYMLFQESTEPSLIHYENFEDPEALNVINMTHFKDNPLDLYRL